MFNEFKIINEKLFLKQTQNGLPVYILSRKGIKTFYMAALVNFGSIDLQYENIKDNEGYSIIPGTAHFLEHKLFESKDENIFEQFSKSSASVNAYTNFTSTVFYFYCTDKIEKNIKLFLDIIQDPYITEENTSKEKGIIIQEIKMYNDNPYWKAYSNFLSGIYNENYAKNDVAGTEEDVLKITRDSLIKCFNDFYVSDNMALYIIGDIDSEDVFRSIESNWNIRSGIQKIKRTYPLEQRSIVRDIVTEKFDINENLFVMGFKEDHNGITSDNILIKEIIQKIVLEYLLGSVSPVYEELYDENYIDSTLSYGTNIFNPFFFNIISCSSKNPEYVKKRILEELKRIRESGFNHKAFENIKKMLTGSYIKSMDDENTLINNMIQYHNKGANFFNILDVINGITMENVVNELQHTFRPENLCMSIVEPL